MVHGVFVDMVLTFIRSQFVCMCFQLFNGFGALGDGLLVGLRVL